MSDNISDVLGDWTVVTFRNALTNKVVLVEGTREEPDSTRAAIDDLASWADARTADTPVGADDLLFMGDLGATRSVLEADRVAVEIVAGYGRDEALQEVIKVARRHKAAARWPEPVPRAAPKPRRTASARSRPAARSTASRPASRPSAPRAPVAPAPPPAPDPKPCPSCFMYPSNRAIQSGECDQCGAALAS